MKLCASLLISILTFGGCAALRSPAVPSHPVERLRYDIDRLLSDTLFILARTGIKIVSLKTGETLYERNSQMLLRPASNMKLLTTSTAIGLLGKDYQFRTAILTDTVLSPDTLHGNLYLKGYGNPDLKSADLDSLIAQIKWAGIKAVTGNIVSDVQYFDDLYWGAGWMWDDEPYEFEAFITPLSINDNCVRIKVTPGVNPGDTVSVSVEPVTSYVKLMNTATTVTDTALVPLNVTRLFKERLNTIIVDGQMLASSRPREYVLSVWQPELYASHLLKETLEDNGIAVNGSAQIGIAPMEAREIATHTWGFDSVVVNLNKVSDNLSAENTLKTLGAFQRGLPGTAENGIYETKLFLSQFGIDTTKFLMVDGSGVSHYNLLTAEMLVQLLTGMAQRPDLFPLFYESLPIAGVDGTLSSRMKGTLAEGNLKAKTGSISGVSSLSGYVTTRDGEMLAFSILMQNFLEGTRAYRMVQDSIGARLAEFSRTLAPRAPAQ
ncbi:MAG: D-alanyl-D-alanine carboxypeptidase/D-alanyl-D-alanine-endopeptidase [Ignavibacteriae bacterium]|nr:D-alanyl-D-alanine carboxypeptidase/D-alanyl-D-alanine-endopeptidase [Ignavibacteriota bacterium]